MTTEEAALVHGCPVCVEADGTAHTSTPSTTSSAILTASFI
jgi:hypothetical protein